MKKKAIPSGIRRFAGPAGQDRGMTMSGSSKQFPWLLFYLGQHEMARGAGDSRRRHPCAAAGWKRLRESVANTHAIARGARPLSDTLLPTANADAMVRRRAAATGIDARIGNRMLRITEFAACLRSGGTHRECRADDQRRIDATTQFHDRRPGAVKLDEAERICAQGRDAESAPGSTRPLMGEGGLPTGRQQIRLFMPSAFLSCKEARQGRGPAGFECRENNPAAGCRASVRRYRTLPLRGRTAKLTRPASRQPDRQGC